MKSMRKSRREASFEELEIIRNCQEGEVSDEKECGNPGGKQALKSSRSSETARKGKFRMKSMRKSRREASFEELEFIRNCPEGEVSDENLVEVQERSKLSPAAHQNTPIRSLPVHLKHAYPKCRNEDADFVPFENARMKMRALYHPKMQKTVDGTASKYYNPR